MLVLNNRWINVNVHHLFLGTRKIYCQESWKINNQFLECPEEKGGRNQSLFIYILKVEIPMHYSNWIFNSIEIFVLCKFSKIYLKLSYFSLRRKKGMLFSFHFIYVKTVESFNYQVEGEQKELKLNWKVLLFFRVKREQRPISPDSGLESEKPTGELAPFISFVITINVVQGIYNEKQKHANQYVGQKCST